MRGGLLIVGIGVAAALAGCGAPAPGVFAPEWISAPGAVSVDDDAGLSRVRIVNASGRDLRLRIDFEGPFRGAAGVRVVRVGEALEVETAIVPGPSGEVSGALVLREGIREARVLLSAERSGARADDAATGAEPACTLAACAPRPPTEPEDLLPPVE